jgi:hypothetical protein
VTPVAILPSTVRLTFVTSHSVRASKVGSRISAGSTQVCGEAFE